MKRQIQEVISNQFFFIFSSLSFLLNSDWTTSSEVDGVDKFKNTEDVYTLEEAIEEASKYFLRR